ncbi:FAD-binding monooxygenase, PheA/TfdB family, similarity to 2,4-dichlorophenol 6-monooxygenase [Minicystis rosea]|nr:FAD-binding monooxygenase, PheA/TfdB family, similarity to 2,4-dichlorophenol 6-monooxygenase [Minicystis rosea]
MDGSTSVLVVGGSLVGLSAAMFLAWEGVPCVLVEPHTGSHPHPRAIGYTPRTMELFRAVGIASQIPEAPPGFRLSRARVESLAGAWFESSEWTPEAKTKDVSKVAPITAFSTSPGAAIAQDRLEPILRGRARELGADLRLGTELVRFEQDATGVTASLREREGRTYSLHADYVIAADGTRSGIREALGIGRKGPGHLQTMRSVLFRAPLEPYLEKGISQFEIDQPELKAFLTTYGDGRWVLMFHDDVERDEAALRGAIQKAIGRMDLPIEIITTGRWELAAAITDRFSSGRVFLAGDAAHTLPPTRGGFGANTGIHDVHNLAWKLAAVLAGRSTKDLLATYHDERHPVAWERLEQTFARPDYAKHGAGFADGVPIRDEVAMELGQLYRSSAIVGAGLELPPAARPDEWAGQPGTRAPHLWIQRAGERVSTLDWFGHRWVLLAGDDAWSEAAVAATRALGIDVARVAPEPADVAAVHGAFGIEAGGASLVRPDGYIAWRSVDRAQDSAGALTSALAKAASAVRGAG